MIPQRGVTVGSWSGQGWIVMDEESGAAGYMICGGLHGDNTVLSGGSLTQIVHNLVHLYEKILTLIKVIVIGGGPISVGLRLLKAVLMIMSYMDQLIVLPIIAYPLAAFYMIIGIAFIYIGIVALITALEGFYATLPRRIRKKEYAYA